MTFVLTLNCGSSSIKSQLVRMPGETQVLQLNLADIGLKRGTWHWDCDGVRRTGHAVFPTYAAGLQFLMRMILRDPRSPITGPADIAAVAHRVVHGGPRFIDSTIITSSVLRDIQANRKLAPLHTPPNLEGIRVAQRLVPAVPHVAVFDTGFHQTMPAYAAAYALPHHFFQRHALRRYGFHGISYRYVIGEAAAMLGRPARRLKLIACHLGSGCSVCAIDRGKSLDTSMGFTPLEGLMMRTRCGDIDAGLLLHLATVHGYTTKQLNRLLNHRSGLLGVSGGASTMPEVIRRMRAGDAKSRLAFEMFCYRVEKYIGAYVAALGGLDGLIFTAGIGENEPVVRAQIVKWCRGFGLKIDTKKNLRTRGATQAIHARSSQAAILVIPTNEGRIMARDAYALLR